MVHRVVLLTVLGALVAFCVVQDRITADGATRYGRDALAALARHQPVTPVAQVMEPAIRQSVRLGLAASGVVLVAGIGVAAAVQRGRRG